MADEEPQTVPIQRLKEELQAKRAALADLAETRKELELAQSKASTVDTLAKQLEELRAKQAADASAWDAERAVYQIGINDPEAIDVARHLHQRLPEKDRPALADWLKAAKEDPTKAPKALQAYLSTPEPQGNQKPPADQKPPKAGGGSTTTTGGSTAPLSDDAIRSMRIEAQRTGDWSAWEAAGLAGKK